MELKGFKRVRIEAGAEQDVTLDLKARDLAYWDTPNHAWRVEKEQVRVLAGGSSDNLPVQATLDVQTSSAFDPIKMRELTIESEKQVKPERNQNLGVYRIGGSISPPTVVYKPVAEYSDEAREKHFEGICLISLIVDAEGNPQNPRIIRAAGMGLDEKALEAVRKYRFKPAMKDGQTPVPVMITIEVNFRQ